MFVLILNQIFSGFYYLFGVLYILIFQLSISTFWLPVFAIRLIAIQIAKWRPDFGEILSTTDVLLSEDVTKKHRGSAMITLALKGIISADEMRTLFVKTVLEKRQPQNPKLLQFPELKQYQTKHLGFLFYRNDPNFKIENYIHEDISQKDDPDFRSLETILENVSYRPYPSKRSAWEMFLVPNFKDPKFQPNSEPTTLLVLRIHHTQIDGYSLLNVLVKGLAQKATYVTPKPTTLENTDVVNFFNSVPKFIEGFVGGQTRYLHNLRFRRAIEDRNPKAVGKVYQRLTQPITINLVKKVAHRYNVRVPAVLMAMVGQNLTKIFEKSEKVPKTAYASYGVPMPNHPGRLTNHVKVGMMTISLSKQNIVVRMKELNEAFLKLKDDPTTNVILYLGSVFGSLFPPMTKFFLKHSAYVPFSITNFVVESEGFSIGGRECIRFTGGCGPHEDISDALITILGYKDHITVGICANDNLLSEEEAEQVIHGVWDDFQTLVRQPA